MKTDTSSSASFPIMGQFHHAKRRYIDSTKIPWAMIAPHEPQALRNHFQSIARLASRGGLSHDEAVAVLEDRPWHAMDLDAAVQRLDQLVSQFLDTSPA